MWINLQPDELKLIRHCLGYETGDDVSLLITKLEEWEIKARSPLHKHYRQVAFDCHHRDGEIEIDEESDDTVMVAVSDDDGAYVMAWVWIDDDTADICTECGDFPGSDTYGTVGDGYDGLCPSCADKAEPEEDPYTFEAWQKEVIDGKTEYGFWEWAEAKKKFNAA